MAGVIARITRWVTRQEMRELQAEETSHQGSGPPDRDHRPHFVDRIVDIEDEIADESWL